jgi:pimeloyl-ACP methyl ester carboxylesterase
MKSTALRPKASLKQRVVRTSALCGALYLVACVGCASFQRRLIYFPQVLTSAEVDQKAAGEGLERWKNPSGETIGWKRLSVIQPVRGQILIMHGNAGCAFQCGHYADVIQQAAALDVFIVEYPGYADRPGAPSERSLDQSACEALQLLATNRPVYLVGESLGTGVAAYVAGKYPEQVAGVVLLAPYNRLADVGQAHMRFLPVSWILTDRFPAEDDLRHYHGPVAMLVAGRDPVIPEKFGRRLYEGFAGPKHLWEFPEGDHGTVMVQPVEVWREIIAFLGVSAAD